MKSQIQEGHILCHCSFYFSSFCNSTNCLAYIFALNSVSLLSFNLILYFMCKNNSFVLDPFEAWITSGFGVGLNVHWTLRISIFRQSYPYIENICWICFACLINSPQTNTQFPPKRPYSLSQIVLSYLVLIDAEGEQLSITPYTSGLCDAVIGVSCHYYGSKHPISCAWWWSFKAIKKEIYLSSQRQRRTRCCMKYRHHNLPPWFHCFRCLIFPSLHPLILLQWRYAFIKRKRPKSFLAPS